MSDSPRPDSPRPDSPRPDSPESAPADVAAALIELATATVTTDDTVGLFTMLSNRAVQLLGIDAAGVLLVSPTGNLTAIGSSNHTAHLLDLFQIQTEQGPCLQCCLTGEPVVDTDLGDDGPWPLFAQTAREWGYRSVYALPLAARGQPLGALNLFTTTPLSISAMGLGQALADIATLGLIQADPGHDAEVVARALHRAMESRITVEQAKGVLAVRFDEDADASFHRLLAAAAATGSTVGSLAASVVNRTTDVAADQALSAFQSDSTSTPRQKA